MDDLTKIGIVCCSNGQPYQNQKQNKSLANVLQSLGYEAVFSDYIYAKDGLSGGTARERADAILHFYKDASIKFICDISGGDIANEILDFLDYRLIAANPKQLWGYSDLTTVLNAIYTKTGNPSVLYQLKNLVYGFGQTQQENFAATVTGHTPSLFQFEYEFLQGTHMEGVVVGGNIRCLLKLAGTEYFPDMQDKLLLLESYGGEAPQILSYFSQCSQMGVFAKISGIIIGTFTAMCKNESNPPIFQLLQPYINRKIPVIQTSQIGHGADSKAVEIGAFRRFD